MKRRENGKEECWSVAEGCALTRKRTREQRKKGCARTRLMSMKAMAFVNVIEVDSAGLLECV